MMPPLPLVEMTSISMIVGSDSTEEKELHKAEDIRALFSKYFSKNILFLEDSSVH